MHVTKLVCEPASTGRSITGGSPRLGRRLGRVAAGGVLALGPLIVSAQAAVVHALDRAPLLTTAPLIAVLWLSAFVAWQLARRFGRSNAALAFFDDDAFASACFVVPAIGVALAGPLSLHATIGLPLWIVGVVMGDPGAINAFDGYVVLALVGTVHVHVLFALILATAALATSKGQPAKVPLWPCVLAATVPGLLLLFPPVLVWVTGLAISRLYLRRAARWFDDDSADDDRAVASA